MLVRGNVDITNDNIQQIASNPEVFSQSIQDIEAFSALSQLADFSQYSELWIARILENDVLSPESKIKAIGLIFADDDALCKEDEHRERLVTKLSPAHWKAIAAIKIEFKNEADLIVDHYTLLDFIYGEDSYLGADKDDIAIHLLTHCPELLELERSNGNYITFLINLNEISLIDRYVDHITPLLLVNVSAQRKILQILSALTLENTPNPSRVALCRKILQIPGSRFSWSFKNQLLNCCIKEKSDKKLQMVFGKEWMLAFTPEMLQEAIKTITNILIELAARKSGTNKPVERSNIDLQTKGLTKILTKIYAFLSHHQNDANRFDGNIPGDFWIHVKRSDGQTLLQIAITVFHDVAMVSRLIGLGVNLNDGGAALRSAIGDRLFVRPEIEVVDILIQAGANLKEVDGNEASPLHLAAEYGYVEIARKLIVHGADVNLFRPNYETPLYQAAQYNQIDVVALLMESGATVSPVNGASPLMKAIACGFTEVAKILIRKSKAADIEASVERSILDRGAVSTPLSLAIEMANVEIVALLLEYCPEFIKYHTLHSVSSPRYVSAQGIRLTRSTYYLQIAPLNLAIYKSGNNVAIVDLLIKALIKAGEDFNASTPLCAAASWGYVAIAQLLVGYGANVNEDAVGSTPLGYAAEHGHHDMVMYLLSQPETNLSRRMANGFTSFMIYAVRADHPDLGLLKRLMNKTVEFTVSDYNAVLKARQTMPDYLKTYLKLVFDSRNNYRADRGKTRLMFAVIENDLEEVNEILRVGTNLLARDENGKNALDYAKESKVANELMIRRLQEAMNNADTKEIIQHVIDNNDLPTLDFFLNMPNFKVDGESSAGQTPLCLAAAHGHTAAVSKLLAVGARIDSLDNNFPLHAAVLSGSESTVTTLLDAGADIDRPNQYGHTAFFLTLMHKFFTPNVMVRLLGGKTNSHKGREVLFRLLSDGSDHIYSDRLIWLGVNDKDDNGETVLHIAAKANKVAEMRHLLTLSSILLSLNTQNRQGLTALHVAAECNHLDIVALLLQANADRAILTSGGNSAFDMAVTNQNQQIAGLLLLEAFGGQNTQSYVISVAKKERAELVRNSIVMMTPCVRVATLVLAAQQGEDTAAKCLVDQGIAIDTVDARDMTALHHAVLRKDKNTISILLRLSADVHIESKRVPSVFDTAMNQSNTELMQLFIQHNAINNSDFKKILITAARDSNASLLNSLNKHRKLTQEELLVVQDIANIFLWDASHRDLQIFLQSLSDSVNEDVDEPRKRSTMSEDDGTSVVPLKGDDEKPSVKDQLAASSRVLSVPLHLRLLQGRREEDRPGPAAKKTVTYTPG